MYTIAKPFYMFVNTPLHAGTGNEIGIIDMPIQREKHTGFPKIEASTLKGCLRADIEKRLKEKKEIIELLFGSSTQGDNSNAGAIGITDARLLLFPVKSLKNIFAWITCPMVLEKFRSELSLAGIELGFELPGAGTVPENSTLVIDNNVVILEEYTFDVKKDTLCGQLAKWLSENILPNGEAYEYWRTKITRDIVVLPDEDYRDFVNISTELAVRIRINPATGTVESKALFTEEYIPCDSVLYSLVFSGSLFTEDNEKKKLLIGTYYEGQNEAEAVMSCFESVFPTIFSVGGNSTLGKGIVAMRM